MGSNQSTPSQGGKIWKRSVSKLTLSEQREKRERQKLQFENIILSAEQSNPFEESSDEFPITATNIGDMTTTDDDKSKTEKFLAQGAFGKASAFPPEHMAESSSARATKSNASSQETARSAPPILSMTDQWDIPVPNMDDTTDESSNENSPLLTIHRPNNGPGTSAVASSVTQAQPSCVAEASSSLGVSSNSLNAKEAHGKGAVGGPSIKTREIAHPPLFDPDYLSDAQDLCMLCGKAYTTARLVGASIDYEKKAFLPCGHHVGHHCFLEWISTPKAEDQHLRCPHACTSLRHTCTHLVAPTRKPPTQLHRNPLAIRIPGPCEFCKTAMGGFFYAQVVKLITKRRDARKKAVVEAMAIEERRVAETAAAAAIGEPKAEEPASNESSKKKRKFLFLYKNGKKLPPAEKRLEQITTKLCKAEAKLSRSQTRWYRKMWTKRWGPFRGLHTRC